MTAKRKKFKNDKDVQQFIELLDKARINGWHIVTKTKVDCEPQSIEYILY